MSSQGALSRLAFWAKGMTQINSAGMDWPGFSYTPAEWARFRQLSEPISAGRYQAFTWVNAAIFIVLAALGIVGIFLPLATLLFPVPAETSALKFALMLAGCAFLIIGIGLPISLSLASRLMASDDIRAALTHQTGDEALAAKVSWQINRIMLVMCGLLVPGILLFIAYDIDAGPVITALKWLAIAAIGLTLVVGALRRKS